MDASLSMNEFCRDHGNLLSLLERAEEVAASNPSNSARETDFNNLGSYLFDPTPIRPDHEVAIRKNQSLVKHNPQQMLSSFSEVSSDVDNEPLNLEETYNIPENFLFPIDGLFPIDRNISNPATKDRSSNSIRFRKYQASQWDDRFKELLLFQEKYGHLLVPHSYPPNPKLSQWVKRQRNQYKRKQKGHHSTLTDEREKLLLEAGFIFDSHRAVWQTRFGTLKAFYLANGHCRIPSQFEKGSLNVWMKHQRRHHSLLMKGEKSPITGERIAALNSIGFDWNPRNLLRPNKT
ncbi:helicase domain protein [Nitzschia inconspicua]|uniref:Helicase domain protein n=1 Tax=Nitzschia inconspicua TaxID=303405 RepID=A0A9K3PAG7_9STRA|nr:helicase domain protein [Nitzschia inconspicua]